MKEFDTVIIMSQVYLVEYQFQKKKFLSIYLSSNEFDVEPFSIGILSNLPMTSFSKKKVFFYFLFFSVFFLFTFYYCIDILKYTMTRFSFCFIIVSYCLL